ncbi:MAG: phosphotransferase family protein [Rhodospirillales bacterium]|nr:phosphotransferase family protein [Rhodospirillales bacterium]
MSDADFRPAGQAVEQDWAALAAWLAARGHVLARDPAPRQFAGGLANLNYLITLDGAPAVLRRPPLGELPAGSHDMAREHRILSRLADALDFVPRSLILGEDAAVIGARFQILEYRPGRVIRASLPADLAGDPAIARRLSETLIDTLAAIHAVDPDAVGLGDLGRPQGFLGRAMAGWAKRGLAVAEPGTEALHADLAAWLRRHERPDGPAALLHNDFKLDNVILDPATLRPVAVVDWDQGTRGDALFDLATLLSYWTEADDPPAQHEMAQMPATAPGFLNRAEAVAHYAAATGRDVSDFLFYRVLAMHKLGVIFLQLGARHRSGATADARYAKLGAIGTGILEFAADVAAGRRF